VTVVAFGSARTGRRGAHAPPVFGWRTGLARCGPPGGRRVCTCCAARGSVALGEEIPLGEPPRPPRQPLPSGAKRLVSRPAIPPRLAGGPYIGDPLTRPTHGCGQDGLAQGAGGQTSCATRPRCWWCTPNTTPPRDCRSHRYSRSRARAVDRCPFPGRSRRWPGSRPRKLVSGAVAPDATHWFNEPARRLTSASSGADSAGSPSGKWQCRQSRVRVPPAGRSAGSASRRIGK
jgi:hypothetical protein